MKMNIKLDWFEIEFVFILWGETQFNMYVTFKAQTDNIVWILLFHQSYLQ